MQHFNPEIETVIPMHRVGAPTSTLTTELLGMLLGPEATTPAYDLVLIKRTLLSVAVATLKSDLPGAGLAHDFLGDILSAQELTRLLADIRSGELTARHLASA